jgi:leader peptidase (prepilin peptidase)/N-methyltransferase
VTFSPTGLALAFVGGVGALGLLVGSFLNVVAYRVPAGRSIVRPRSACPSCRSPIRHRDNVPIVSWLLLRGRCRDCSAVVSSRYPRVEATTGLLFAMLAAARGPSAVLPALLYVAAAGVALVLIDLSHHRLPDVIVLPSYPALAALLGLAGCLSGDFPVARTAFSGAVWLAVYALIWLTTLGRGIGLGDVKLSGLLGLLLGWLGWGPSLVGLFAGFVVGSAVGVVLLASGRAGRRTKIAHGPFMFAGAALAVFAGEPLSHVWLALSCPLPTACVS